MRAEGIVAALAAGPELRHELMPIAQHSAAETIKIR
jgi:hypothetical protein